MTQQFRLATLEDTAVLHDMMYRSFTPLREVGIDWPSVNATPDMIEDNIRDNACYVLEVDGKIVSTLSIRFPWESDKPVSKYPFIWWLATDPDYNGQGYGSEMMRYVEETILRDTLKAPAVVLGTSARKVGWLEDVYQRRGYETFFEMEDPTSGDKGVMMVKVLIPERYNPSFLTPPPWSEADE
ncbi:acetyltransferase [Staphylococcus microti]|uniref:Acetyltransferase n=1 Tax=Staphylococcus microti TaxID=569857 RepID=A0A0D6XT49_9STAP|nr:GNAT family N-acetyltransferase [Staphylococcus microti]KIX91787.1 acetyltransferase [Staphylococcus microti]PNZ84445.1 N-acetyltransferase [Staphylococcus microti]SUM58355.1 GNAT family acetyltransferase [Staphylococcus microti]